MAAQRIAVINSESSILHFLDQLLRDEGFTTALWAGGSDAHEMVVREQPDLIILDISLGAPMSGLVLLDLLKLDPATKDIPVIACTTDLSLLHQQEERLRELKCAIQPKPFSFDEILAAIERLIGPARSDP